MFTRHRYATATALVLFALASHTALAQQEPAHPPPIETHELTIDRQVEIAQSMADHEAIAQRLEEDAARFERQATEHEQLAQHYRRSPSRGPKANAANLAHHCERIAKNLKTSAADTRAMARMHREIAHKLVK